MRELSLNARQTTGHHHIGIPARDRERPQHAAALLDPVVGQDRQRLQGQLEAQYLNLLDDYKQELAAIR